DAGRAGEARRDVMRGEQDRGNAGLHVRDAAAVEPVAVRFAGKRIPGPGARAERHGVEVSRETEWRLGIAAARARYDAGASRRVLVVGNAEAPVLEQTAGVPRAIVLAAGRIDGIEGEERPGKRDGVGGAHAANGTIFNAPQKRLALANRSDARPPPGR